VEHGILSVKTGHVLLTRSRFTYIFNKTQRKETNACQQRKSQEERKYIACLDETWDNLHLRWLTLNLAIYTRKKKLSALEYSKDMNIRLLNKRIQVIIIDEIYLDVNISVLICSLGY